MAYQVRVGHCRRRPRFALEAEHGLRVSERFLGQHLDGHGPCQPRIARPVDLSHPACRDERDDLVRADTSSGGDSGHDGDLGNCFPISALMQPSFRKNSSTFQRAFTTPATRERMFG